MAELIACNGDVYLRQYFQMAPEVQRADHDLFVKYPHRTHFIRDPYPYEVMESRTVNVDIVVVRRYASDTFGRRAFAIWDTDRTAPLRDFNTRDEELLGRALWSVWDSYNSEIELSSDVVNMAVTALAGYKNLGQG
jgi:hypothetical protein